MRRAIDSLDRRSLFALAGFLIICFAVAALGGAVTRTAIDGWYAGLQKPFFAPPNWLFGPVWTVLFALMAVAAWRIWRSRGDTVARRRALSAFAVQLALNCAWPFAFFGGRSPVLGLLVIVTLAAAILWTVITFARLDPRAAWLMAPYAAWVAFAAVLNLGIVALN